MSGATLWSNRNQCDLTSYACRRMCCVVVPDVGEQEWAWFANFPIGLNMHKKRLRCLFRQALESGCAEEWEDAVLHYRACCRLLMYIKEALPPDVYHGLMLCALLPHNSVVVHKLKQPEMMTWLDVNLKASGARFLTCKNPEPFAELFERWSITGESKKTKLAALAKSFLVSDSSGIEIRFRRLDIEEVNTKLKSFFRDLEGYVHRLVDDDVSLVKEFLESSGKGSEAENAANFEVAASHYQACWRQIVRVKTLPQNLVGSVTNWVAEPIPIFNSYGYKIRHERIADTEENLKSFLHNLEPYKRSLVDRTRKEMEDFQRCSQKGFEAEKAAHFEVAESFYQNCHGILLSVQILSPDLHAWLLLWVSIPLFSLYYGSPERVEPVGFSIPERLQSALQGPSHISESPLFKALDLNVRIIRFSWGYRLEKKQELALGRHTICVALDGLQGSSVFHALEMKCWEDTQYLDAYRWMQHKRYWMNCEAHSIMEKVKFAIPDVFLLLDMRKRDEARVDVLSGLKPIGGPELNAHETPISDVMVLTSLIVGLRQRGFFKDVQDLFSSDAVAKCLKAIEKHPGDPSISLYTVTDRAEMQLYQAQELEFNLRDPAQEADSRQKERLKELRSKVKHLQGALISVFGASGPDNDHLEKLRSMYADALGSCYTRLFDLSGDVEYLECATQIYQEGINALLTSIRIKRTMLFSMGYVAFKVAVAKYEKLCRLAQSVSSPAQFEEKQRGFLHELRDQIDHLKRSIAQEPLVIKQLSEQGENFVLSAEHLYHEQYDCLQWLLFLQDQVQRKRFLGDPNEKSGETSSSRGAGGEDASAEEGLLWTERGRSRSLACQVLLSWLEPPQALNREGIPRRAFTDGRYSQSYQYINISDSLVWDALKKSQDACGKGTVFVLYNYFARNSLHSNYKGRCLVYVLSQKRQVERRLLPTLDLETVLPRIQLAMNSRDFNEVEVLSDLENVYDQLIAPIHDLIKDMEEDHQLVFCANEILTDVPFPLLRHPERGYLFERHTVSATPSLRLLGLLDQRREDLEGLRLAERPGLVVGAPFYKDPLMRLPGASKEIMAISEICGESIKIQTITGKDATLDNFIEAACLPMDSQEYRSFIHVAVHGVVKRLYPYGALMFGPPISSTDLGARPLPPAGLVASSPGGPCIYIFEEKCGESNDESGEKLEEEPVEDGGNMRTAASIKTDPSCLSSESIVAQDEEWKTLLVVLSACDLSKGKVAKEGVLNLPRALLIAGVPCAVASQWLLSDKVAPELMKEMYLALKEGNNVASSLRVAMCKMLKKGVKGGEVCEWGALMVWGLPTVSMPGCRKKEEKEKEKEKEEKQGGMETNEDWYTVMDAVIQDHLERAKEHLEKRTDEGRQLPISRIHALCFKELYDKYKKLEEHHRLFQDRLIAEYTIKQRFLPVSQELLIMQHEENDMLQDMSFTLLNFENRILHGFCTCSCMQWVQYLEDSFLTKIRAFHYLCQKRTHLRTIIRDKAKYTLGGTVQAREGFREALSRQSSTVANSFLLNWSGHAETGGVMESPVETLEKSCGPGAVLVLYDYPAGTDSGESCFAYVLTKERVNQVGIKVEGVSMMLEKLFFAMNPEQYKAEIVLQVLEYIYNALIAPIYELLKDMNENHKLVISANKMLANVPFSILRHPCDTLRSERAFYLFERHTVCITPSLEILQCLYHYTPRPRMYCRVVHSQSAGLVVGAPCYQQGKSREVMTISAVFKGKPLHTIEGSTVTMDNFMKATTSAVGSYQPFIHLAVRAQVNNYGTIHFGPVSNPSDEEVGERDKDDEDDDREALILMLTRLGKEKSEANKKKGILTSEMILDSDWRQWNSEVVVLSACNSAIRQVAQENVLTLPRALMGAGVSCVVVSQWEMGDQFTSELMEEMYIGALRDKLDVASALRYAMRKMHDKGGDVYKWGAFKVWGLPTIKME